MSVVKRIESYLPDWILRVYRRYKRFYFWMLQQFATKSAVRKLQKKDTPINVIFLALFPAVWKYDSLFRQMQRDANFNPIILLCPVENVHIEQRNEYLKKMRIMFSNRGYQYVEAYQNGKYIDIESLQPQILFYNTQYPNQIYKGYYVYAMRKHLKCFVNYAFSTVPYEWSLATAFHGLMWKYFVECTSNEKLVHSYSPREYQNTIVVGYPIYDEYQEAPLSLDDWKIKDSVHKRIIWAPHHSIAGHDGLLQMSTFLLYYDTMLELAKKYKGKIQIAFKPHPLLREALYQHPEWGKNRTDEYYLEWDKGINTSLNSGTYMSLFKTSDAMIHDSGSFIAEYLYTNKPVMYLENKDRIGQSNEVGQCAYRCHYIGKVKEDIERFILDVVLDGNDPMKEFREDFYNKNLLPPNNCSVAENIINEIKKELGR